MMPFGIEELVEIKEELSELLPRRRYVSFILALVYYSFVFCILIALIPYVVWKNSRLWFKNIRPKGRFDVLYCWLTWFKERQTIGGSLSHARGIINSLDNRMRVLVVSGEEIGKPTRKYKLPYLRKPRVVAFLWNVFLSFLVIPIAMIHRPKIIYRRYSWNGFAGAIAAFLTGAKYYLEWNGSDIWMNRYWARNRKWELPIRLAETFILRMADKVISVSEESAEGIDRCIVAPNGVDVGLFNPRVYPVPRYRIGVERDAFLVGWIGTFARCHGLDILMEAIGRDRDVKWFLAGHGELLDEVLSRGRGRIVHYRQIDHIDMPRYLRTCNALVNIPKDNEDGTPFFGSPTKLFEYLASGVPVITTNVGQQGRILTHGENCLMIEPSWVDLLGAIYDLKSDPDLGARLGRNAFELVRNNYTWDHSVGKIFGV